MDETELEIWGLCKSLSDIHALTGINLDVRGEAHVLLGQNGAENSALIKILNGAQITRGNQNRRTGR